VIPYRSNTASLPDEGGWSEKGRRKKKVKKEISDTGSRTPG